MKAKEPLVLRIEFGLFYGAMAAFSLGIALQQIVLNLFALFQLMVGLVYGVRLGTLFMPGRRAGVVFLMTTILCAVVAQMSYPSPDPTRIHWAIGAFWVIAPAIARRANWQTLYRTMLVFSVPGMLYSIYWLLRPAEILWAQNVGFEHYPRAFGFLSNPITYAEGLVVLAGWTLARLHHTRTGPRERLWMRLHLVVSVLIVLFSRVRSGLLGFVVLFLVNALISPRFRKMGLLAVVLVPALFLLNTAIFGFNTASLAERFKLANNSIDLFVNNPIFGIGPNKFNHEIEGVGMLTQHPHNTLLGIITESGVLGLLAYLGFIIALGRQLKVLLAQHKGPDDGLTWVVYGLLFAFISYHIFGLFDYNFADTELLILHALHWGLIAHLTHQSSGRGQGREPQQTVEESLS